MRLGTLLHFKTSKTTATLFAVAPLPVLPSPSITGIFGRLAILFFINTKIKKRFFSILDFTHMEEKQSMYFLKFLKEKTLSLRVNCPDRKA